VERVIALLCFCYTAHYGPLSPRRVIPGDSAHYLALNLHDTLKIRSKGSAMVFQDPMTSLNPVYLIDFQIMQAL
jgi:ABC-type dipeptide/oligopeptide/nickel transport system ATPase component